jgi:hypothetical protein
LYVNLSFAGVPSYSNGLLFNRNLNVLLACPHLILFNIFVPGMKKSKHIVAIIALILSMYISVDDLFFFCMNIDSIEIAMHSDSSDLSHHHHFPAADHFCQKNSFADPGPVFLPRDHALINNQSLADLFLSSIWQPPQKNQLIA